MLNEEKSGRSGDKKPYSRPRLTTYGDVRAITQSVANNGNYDGASRRGPGPFNTGDTG